MEGKSRLKIKTCDGLFSMGQWLERTTKPRNWWIQFVEVLLTKTTKLILNNKLLALAIIEKNKKKTTGID